MVNSTFPNRRLLLMTLGLTYIAIGMLGMLPSASLVRLASNTHVSLEVAGGMFTFAAIGGMLGVVLSEFLIRYIKPKYLLMLGLFFGAQLLRRAGSARRICYIQRFWGGLFGVSLWPFFLVNCSSPTLQARWWVVFTGRSILALWQAPRAVLCTLLVRSVV